MVNALRDLPKEREPMNIKRSIFITPALLAMLLFVGASTGCVKSGAGATLVPKTPQQSVLVYNATLVKADYAVSDTCKSLGAAKTLSLAQTKSCLVVTDKIATVGDSIQSIATSTSPWTAAAAQIKALLDQLGAQALLSQAGITSQEVQTLYSSVLAAITLIQAEVK